MGGSPSSSPSVPNQAWPYMDQASTAIQNATAAMPRYTNTPLSQMLTDFGQSQFNSGGMVPQSQQYYSDVLSGKYLTPQNNPFLSGTMDYMQNQFGKTLGSSLDQLSSTFQAAGQPSSSGTAANYGTQAMQSALQNYQGQLAQLLMGNYQQGLQQQQDVYGMGNVPMANATSAYSGAMAPAAAQYSAAQIPAQMWASLLQGMPFGSTTYGPNETAQYMQGIGGILGGVGGIMGSGMFS